MEKCGKTLYQKVWDDHLIERLGESACLILIDSQLLNEGTSFPAFQKLNQLGRQVRYPERHLAVPDHLIPTLDRHTAPWPESVQGRVQQLEQHCAEHHIPHIDWRDARQGICHVIAPELGYCLPGTTIVCGDSHTSTHGAFGALAFGIGTSEIEHVLATGTLIQTQSRGFRISFSGRLPHGVSAKDCILALIGRIGTGGATGYAVEFAGEVVERFSMEERMTLCNMAIEAGARVGMIAPDDTAFAYLQDRPLAPSGAAWEQAMAYWRTLHSDADAHFDRELCFDVSDLAPQVSWGTSPQDVVAVSGVVPDPKDARDEEDARQLQGKLDYMGLLPGTAITDIAIDIVFIGSCTNGRLSDLRSAAGMIRGQRVAAGVRALVVPGSGQVKAAAEAEGLDKVFTAAGFEWRAPGCSMCGGFTDRVDQPLRIASTSNRNFQNRQGRGARTHLVSPAMAAAAAIAGHFVDIRSA